MLGVYVRLIEKELITIDDVPENIREDVRKALESDIVGVENAM